MGKGSQYIDLLASEGRYHFKTDDAQRSLGTSPVAVRATLRRLKRKRWVAQPMRGFYVVVPPEYRSLGCLPPEQFIDQLMQHLGEPYHVALLSAAALHGAAHQQPQTFQVMLDHNRKPLRCGRVKVEFVARLDRENAAATVKMITPRGYISVSSPETTALELVGYADHCGGLDNVATVLADLAEALDGEKLLLQAHKSPVVWSQRLGYLLEKVAAPAQLADPLARWVAENAHARSPLVRSLAMTGTQRSERWKLALNTTVEPDI